MCPNQREIPGWIYDAASGTLWSIMQNQRLLLLSAFALTSALSAALACGSSSSGSSELTGDPSSGGASGGNAGDASPGGGAGASNQGEDTGDDASDPQGAGGSASGGSSGSGDPSGGGGMNGEAGAPNDGAGGSGGGMGGGNTPGLGPVANHCPGDPEDYVLLVGTDGPDVLDDEGQPLRAIIGFPGDDTITTSGTQGEGTTCALGGAGNDTIHLTGHAPGGVGALFLVGGGGADRLSYEVEGAAGGDGALELRPPFVFKDFAPGQDKVRIDLTKVHGTSLESVSDFTEGADGGHASCDSYVVVLDPMDGEVWLSQTCGDVPRNVLLGILQSATPPSVEDIELLL